MKACYKLILWFWWEWSSIPRISKIAKLQYLYSKNNLEMWLIFCMHINIRVPYKLISTLWAYKLILSLLIDMIKHSQSTQNNTFTIFLHYLKKKLGMEFTFCMLINIKDPTSWHYCFWWKWPDMSKVPKIGSWSYFCNILIKKWCTCFCVL